MSQTFESGGASQHEAQLQLSLVRAPPSSHPEQSRNTALDAGPASLVDRNDDRDIGEIPIRDYDSTQQSSEGTFFILIILFLHDNPFQYSLLAL